MKYLPIVTAAALLASTAFLVARADDAETPAPTPVVAPTPTSPVVKLTSDGGTCTAFYIGNDEFVTAGHCFFETERPKAYVVQPDIGPTLDVVPALVLDTNVGPFPDIAILIARAPVDKQWTPDVLDCAYVPKAGDRVSTIGFPGGNGEGSTYSEGYVNGGPRLIGRYMGGWGVPVIPVTLPIFHGHSGSPVYHDSKVVGIAVGGTSVQAAWSYIQPITAVCAALIFVD